MTLCIFTLNLIFRSVFFFFLRKHYEAPQKRTHCSPKRNVLPTLWDPEPNALCTEKKHAAHRNETRCAPEWNTLLTLVEPQAENAPHVENETRGRPCETHEPNALRRERDEPHPYPLEARGTKKSYLTNLSSLHLQPACPTSWWEKPAHATRKNQKSKQTSANRTNNTHRAQRMNGEGRVGKMFQGKKELGPCRWENHEWRKTAQARW